MFLQLSPFFVCFLTCLIIRICDGILTYKLTQYRRRRRTGIFSKLSSFPFTYLFVCIESLFYSSVHPNFVLSFKITCNPIDLQLLVQDGVGGNFVISLHKQQLRSFSSLKVCLSTTPTVTLSTSHFQQNCCLCNFYSPVSFS